MKRQFSRLMLFPLLAAGFTGASAYAQDRGKCAGRTLYGSYAVKATGILYLPALALPNGDAPRIAQVGVAFFDGNGKFILTAGVNSFAGNIVPNPPKGITGTYTLDADCTGTILFAGLGGPESIYFVLADNGDRMFGLYTTPTGTAPGPAVTIDFMRQWR